MLAAIEQGAALEVPAIWPAEISNALIVLVRRGKLHEEDRKAALAWLRALPVRVDHEMAALAFSELSDLVSRHRLSVCHAVYLELAERRKLPSACKDSPLRQAAKRHGVPLWS